MGSPQPHQSMQPGRPDAWLGTMGLGSMQGADCRQGGEGFSASGMLVGQGVMGAGASSTAECLWGKGGTECRGFFAVRCSWAGAGGCCCILGAQWGVQDGGVQGKGMMWDTGKQGKFLYQRMLME